MHGFPFLSMPTPLQPVAFLLKWTDHFSSYESEGLRIKLAFSFFRKVSCTDTSEWQNRTSFPNIEIPWHDAECQIALEGACQEKRKREELGLKYKQMYWLMGRRSAMPTHNKLVLYKQILKPMWTYGIQLWGYTRPSNTAIIQRFQNKVLRNIVDAPWNVGNADLRRDLNMEMVTA